ncbi:ankyrin repeat protein [Medicago truncatula]|uniref:Ankyrin repeat protein n=1 Tax=Medicago truncatula TaxID=3880 RepID=G7KZK9_MEDTR|nr:ankyrin repeat protein [Medicago truncatula]
MYPLLSRNPFFSDHLHSLIAAVLRPHRRRRTVVTHHRITTPSSPSPPFLHLYRRLTFFFSYRSVSGGHEVVGEEKEGESVCRREIIERNGNGGWSETLEREGGERKRVGVRRERREDCLSRLSYKIYIEKVIFFRASEVDSKGRYPLHLASAEGHIQIVKTLLMTNPNICLIPDNDDKLPIHLAVSRGHVEVVEELKNAKPCSIQKIGDDGSLLHLCVRYNHLEALKYLVQSVNGAQEL